MNPIYVGCHLCHAQVGEACRFGLGPDEEFHTRRIARAAAGGDGIKTEHGIAHGEQCTPISGMEDICINCGQLIARLKKIPDIA